MNRAAVYPNDNQKKQCLETKLDEKKLSIQTPSNGSLVSLATCGLALSCSRMTLRRLLVTCRRF